MKTQKFRVFRYAEKRQMIPAEVRAILAGLMYPPTLAEVPAQYVVSVHERREDGYISHRRNRADGDARDITREQADAAIRFIEIVHDSDAAEATRRIESEFGCTFDACRFYQSLARVILASVSPT